MRFSIRAFLLSILAASSFAWGQRFRQPSTESSSPSVELRLIDSPRWTGSCLELHLQRTNVSKTPVFLNAMYEGVKIYSSVRSAANARGQGPGESWMLAYGWTDLVSPSVELPPGGKMQNTLCIAETFPVKPTGRETFRQVRVQGMLRIVVEYEVPTWTTTYRPRGEGREDFYRTFDKSGHWISSEVHLTVPVPCPNGADASDCSSPPELLAGEHDIHTIEPEPPPEIEFEPLQLQPPLFPIERPAPPKTH